MYTYICIVFVLPSDRRPLCELAKNRPASRAQRLVHQLRLYGFIFLGIFFRAPRRLASRTSFHRGFRFVGSIDESGHKLAKCPDSYMAHATSHYIWPRSFCILVLFVGAIEFADA